MLTNKQYVDINNNSKKETTFGRLENSKRSDTNMRGWNDNFTQVKFNMDFGTSIHVDTNKEMEVNDQNKSLFCDNVNSQYKPMSQISDGEIID